MTSALAGKVVLVTGASKGIGPGMAAAFGAAGANVAVGYARDQEGAERVAAESRAAGGRSPFRATSPKPRTSKPWSPRQWWPLARSTL
jgi:NAD(P)-dependent dehydrogenase (short-subunit alcohol dehydrogenase family)